MLITWRIERNGSIESRVFESAGFSAIVEPVDGKFKLTLNRKGFITEETFDYFEHAEPVVIEKYKAWIKQ